MIQDNNDNDNRLMLSFIPPTNWQRSIRSKMGAGLDLTKIQTKAQKKYIDVYVICLETGNLKKKNKKTL